MNDMSQQWVRGASMKTESPHGFMHVIAKALFGLALYILLFSAKEDIGARVQISAIALLVAAAFLELLAGRMKRISFSFYELAIIASVPLSLAVVFFRPDLQMKEVSSFVAGYSALLLVALLALAVLARSMRLSEVLTIAACAYLAMLVTIFVFYPQEFLTALLPQGQNRWKMRAVAFDLVPNLEGFMFGGGVFLLARKALVGRGRVIFGGLALLSLAVVLAASDRAPLVAIILTLAVLVPFYLPRTSPGFKLMISVGGVLATLLIFSQFHLFSSYFTDLLELKSQTRGFGTGATGRVGIWATGVATIHKSWLQFLFGGGLRSSSKDIIGFSTESSYITIFLDSGIVCGGLIVAAMLATVVRLHGQIRATRALPLEELATLATLIYAMADSIFNRYLLAIGNPTSLLVMLLFIQGAIAARRLPRGQARAATRPPPPRASDFSVPQPKPMSM
jgi:hypothetical protein